MRSGKKGPVFTLVVALIFFLSPLQQARAQGGPAVFRTDPAVLEVGQGQVETVKVILENAQNIYAVDYQATFDPNIVEVVDSDPAQDGIQMIPGDFIKPDFVVINTADNVAGTIHYVATQVNPTPPAVGTGVFLLIQFRGKILGGQTNIISTTSQIADRSGNKLPNQDGGGRLLVVPPKPPTPTLIPTITATLPVSLTATSIPSAAAPTNTMFSEPADQVTYTIRSERLLELVAYLGFGGAIVMILVALWVVISKRRKPNKEKTQ